MKRLALALAVLLLAAPAARADLPPPPPPPPPNTPEPMLTVAAFAVFAGVALAGVWLTRRWRQRPVLQG